MRTPPALFPGVPLNNQQLLEHRYRAETPLRTLWVLFASEQVRLLIAACIFLVKHGPIWLMPLLTATIIDIVVQQRHIAELWRTALFLVLLLLQNIPLYVLYNRQLSKALRSMETRLRSALSRQLQRLSIGYYTRASAGVLQTKVIRDVETIEQMVRQLSDIGLNASSNLIGAQETG